MQEPIITEAKPSARRVRLPPPPIMQGAVLCTILQAAGLVCRGERWVYEALADGRIMGVKSDGRTLIVVRSLHDYVATLPPARVIKAMSRQAEVAAAPVRRRRRTQVLLMQES